MWRLVLMVSCLACAFAGSAAGYWEMVEEDFILIDTGPGRAAAQAGDKTLSTTQHLAAQITLDGSEKVVNIEGWIAYLSLDVGNSQLQLPILSNTQMQMILNLSRVDLDQLSRRN